MAANWDWMAYVGAPSKTSPSKPHGTFRATGNHRGPRKLVELRALVTGTVTVGPGLRFHLGEALLDYLIRPLKERGRDRQA